MSTNDPLGRKPKPETGRRVADYTDGATRERAAGAKKAAKSIWVEHPPQENAVGRILTYRLETLDTDEREQDGLCLAQASQAGKTATAKRVRKVLHDECMAAGGTPNRFQVIIVGLDKKTSLKSVLQDILIEMEDPDWDYGTEKQLRQRIRDFVRRLGTELIVIDECQHLHKEGSDVTDVTDALKRFLDLGIAPMVLIGNFDAEQVYKRNQQLRARLGLPVTLPALDMKRIKDGVHFRNFVEGFDKALLDGDIVTTSPGLTDDDILEALKVVSGGYFGRVARLLQHAAAHAAARHARTIERYDLSCVTRDYAIPSKWTSTDPFSTPLP